MPCLSLKRVPQVPQNTADTSNLVVALKVLVFGPGGQEEGAVGISSSDRGGTTNTFSFHSYSSLLYFFTSSSPLFFHWHRYRNSNDFTSIESFFGAELTVTLHFPASCSSFSHHDLHSPFCFVTLPLLIRTIAITMDIDPTTSRSV